MTLQEMVGILIDKGHGSEYASAAARADYSDLAFELEHPGEVEAWDDCSVCRRRFTRLQMKYHYHPCE